MLRASAAAVPPEQWFARASDASPWWLGLPVLACSPRLPWSVGLRHTPLQLPRQVGRSDLCFPHQHGIAGHSSCFVIRVTQLCRISQVWHTSARDARLVALATAHAPSDLPLMISASIKWVWGACCVGAPLPDREKAFLTRLSHSCHPEWCRVELFVWVLECLRERV
jgi:hypothetical protein